MEKYSLLDLDDYDIAAGEWKSVLENLKGAFPSLGFKKSSHENRISLYAANIPDNCCICFDEGASSIERYHLRPFIKKHGKFMRGINSVVISYEQVFKVIEKYLEEK